MKKPESFTPEKNGCCFHRVPSMFHLCLVPHFYRDIGRKYSNSSYNISLAFWVRKGRFRTNRIFTPEPSRLCPVSLYNNKLWRLLFRHIVKSSLAMGRETLSKSQLHFPSSLGSGAQFCRSGLQMVNKLKNRKINSMSPLYNSFKEMTSLKKSMYWKGCLQAFR